MKFVSLFPIALAALTPIASNAQTRGGVDNSIAARRLSYEKIAGYEPNSKVTDHNAIDLDQNEMMLLISDKTEDSFRAALKVFQEGGHSKSYAEVTVPGLTTSISKKTALSVSFNGTTIKGKAYADYAGGTAGGIVKFQYATGDIQESYVDCQVGGLPIDKQNYVGCLPESGNLKVDTGTEEFPYTYSQKENNKNGRTISKFSTSAQEKMGDCATCPYSEYNKFRIYYGVPNYADHWVTQALLGLKTQFTGPSGTPDFGDYGLVGRGEAAKKGSAYMAVYMYV
eukprot:CAMPEP_0197822788 /NCGR_PEP_ID=MMETSP1437-20131217/52_1 /TAXON_ID=49252 ORGANISM="Eucampia antarctica, Strain CCMP1452" /NCGR_SAMPLE_ID=MMETSP1437 /ASSEMBLY_ACC=CAM_ASM_001096 /LENGTH=282 /DNA_ID=CAMNT_0043421589 /DNA_START=111 /DNA_END=955 /DNA_ORIENTATION=-